MEAATGGQEARSWNSQSRKEFRVQVNPRQEARYLMEELQQSSFLSKI
jgi:hypothetical protein